MPVVGVFGKPESGTVLGELVPGSLVLPGVVGSGDVELPGAGVMLLGVVGSGDVELPGAGVMLLGVVGSGDVELPGAGVMLSGVVGSVELPGIGVVFSGVVGSLELPGAGVVLVGLPGPGVVMFSGVVLVSGVVPLSEGEVAGTVVLPGVLGVTAVPPGQLEFRGKRSHRILNASGDRLYLFTEFPVVELVDESLDCAIWDLLD
ncbi:hypothetical protein NIES4103_51320 [Nostoc sp. NIES-4103]|nr:hypothetical protein NIES4103_51320 [Nostoc sp. NIES-4103]